MEVCKVGDVHEFTIIGLDTDRRRISLSLKSDSGSRAETTGNASDAKPAGAKKIVVVKKGAAGSKPKTDGNQKPRSENRGGQRQYQGSDDGMSYNPFAALLKK